MNDPKVRGYAYLVLALVGLVGTWYFNIQWSTGPFDHTVRGFIEPTYANSASSSFSVDLTVAFLAGSLFMLFEGKRTGMRNTWIYVALSAAIAFAFAFPLFLWARERHLVAAE